MKQKTEYIPFSDPHKTLQRIDHMLSHKISPIKLKEL